MTFSILQSSAVFGRSCSGSISPTLAYLTRSISDAPTPLNDLWSLSLSRVTISCLRDGICPTTAQLLWTLIPVATGGGPSSRWGAGITMNPYTDELYVTGGSSVSNAGTYSVLNDLFSYQLTDAYYQNCVASGDGLQNALAGQQATFSVTCLDIFGQDAATASVYVSISGAVALSPTVSAINGEAGSYLCSYTSGIAGTYGLSIQVGRGGTSQRQLIPSGKYVLTVLPGPTSPASSISNGDFLSLSTAGSVGSFTILARDALGNRRPGKDDVDVLMYWISNSSVLPVPGQVEAH